MDTPTPNNTNRCQSPSAPLSRVAFTAGHLPRGHSQNGVNMLFVKVNIDGPISPTSEPSMNSCHYCLGWVAAVWPGLPVDQSKHSHVVFTQTKVERAWLSYNWTQESRQLPIWLRENLTSAKLYYCYVMLLLSCSPLLGLLLSHMHKWLELTLQTKHSLKVGLILSQSTHYATKVRDKEDTWHHGRKYLITSVTALRN